MADRQSMMDLAKATGAGAATGGSVGAIGGLPGMVGGGAAGALVPLARHLMPGKADAAGLMAQGAMMGPLGIPAMLGGGLMMAGAKPYFQQELEAFDAQDRMRRGE